MDGFRVTPADLQAAERDLLAYAAPAGLDTFVSSNSALIAFPDPALTEALTGLVGAAAAQLQEASRMIPAMAQGLHATAELYHVADKWTGPKPEHVDGSGGHGEGNGEGNGGHGNGPR